MTVCPSVRGDHPRTIASGLSSVHADKPCLSIFTTLISVNLAQSELYRVNFFSGKSSSKRVYS